MENGSIPKKALLFMIWALQKGRFKPSGTESCSVEGMAKTRGKWNEKNILMLITTLQSVSKQRFNLYAYFSLIMPTFAYIN